MIIVINNANKFSRATNAVLVYSVLPKNTRVFSLISRISLERKLGAVTGSVFLGKLMSFTKSAGLQFRMLVKVALACFSYL